MKQQVLGHPLAEGLQVGRKGANLRLVRPSRFQLLQFADMGVGHSPFIGELLGIHFAALAHCQVSHKTKPLFERRAPDQKHMRVHQRLSV